MTGNEIGQYPPVQSESFYGVLRAGRGVIDAAYGTFEMCLRVVSRPRFNTPLKFPAVFPQVVPYSRHFCPIGAPERARIFLGALAYAE